VPRKTQVLENASKETASTGKRKYWKTQVLENASKENASTRKSKYWKTQVLENTITRKRKYWETQVLEKKSKAKLSKKCPVFVYFFKKLLLEQPKFKLK